MTHEEYLQRRTDLVSIRSDSQDSFDKVILAISTGGLALSITFIDRIGKPFNVLTASLIIATWVGLSLVLVANILSFLFAQRNMDKKIKELNDRYRAEQERKKLDDFQEKIFWYRTAVTVCNYLALAFFLVSFGGFIWYIIEIQKHNLLRFFNLGGFAPYGERQGN